MKSKRRVQSIQILISEVSSPLVSKDNEAYSRVNNVSALDKQVTDITGWLSCSKTQNETDKALSEEIRTALALQKTATQQRIFNHVNDREELTAERAFLDAAFRNYPTYSDSRISRLQTTLESETRRTDEDFEECKRPFVIDRGLKT